MSENIPVHLTPEVTELKQPIGNSKENVDLSQYKYFTKASTLSHLSYECPGLHGPGTKQDIRRTTIRQILTGQDRIVIPLFQRKYCWTISQVGSTKFWAVHRQPYKS